MEMDGTAKTTRFSEPDDWEESKEEDDIATTLPRSDALARMSKTTAPKSAWQIHQEYNSMRNLNVNRYDVHIYDYMLQKIDRCRRLTSPLPLFS